MQSKSSLERHQERVTQRKASLQTWLGDTFMEHPRIVFELGCGHGHFLVAYGQHFPQTHCLGIDILGDRISRSKRKAKHLGLTHVHFLKAEASEVPECLPAHTKLDAIFILFPDPWPKRKHHTRRIIQSSFLSALAKRSTDDAQLFFRTDHTEYYAWAKAALQAHSDWQIDPAATWPLEVVTRFQELTGGVYHSLIARRSAVHSKPLP